ncbi:MAG: hypothetical protein WA964_13295 [Ilumatobacter sp.]|uniref:hypothetical protein n=1 Tax=Ilumatobacter sp. TaxID=1967498 RepID=UPI003C7184E2
MANQHPALSELFTHYRSLSAETWPKFEVVLIGGIAGAVIEMGNAPVATDRQAADMFGLIPAAAAIAQSDDAPPAPTWDVDDVDGLAGLRATLLEAAPAIAATPDDLMLRLVPVLRTQLTHDAGDPSRQIRMAWLRTIEALAHPAEHGIVEDDLHRILVETIQHHERSALDAD